MIIQSILLLVGKLNIYFLSKILLIITLFGELLSAILWKTSLFRLVNRCCCKVSPFLRQFLFVSHFSRPLFILFHCIFIKLLYIFDNFKDHLPCNLYIREQQIFCIPQRVVISAIHISLLIVNMSNCTLDTILKQHTCCKCLFVTLIFTSNNNINFESSRLKVPVTFLVCDFTC